MKHAIVLAAGLGTRLGEITKTTPKCLLPIAGVPMLKSVIERLIATGVTEIVINTHYLAEQVEVFVSGLSYHGVKIHLSKESQLLGTGGGIKQAVTYFSDLKDFFVYNADIHTDLDLNLLVKSQTQNDSLVSIACQSVYAPRHLIFDNSDLLIGWGNDDAGSMKIVRESSEQKKGHYLCVQLISPKILKYFDAFQGEFSLFEPYLIASQDQQAIRAVWYNQILWHDIGTPQQLAAARVQS